MRLLFPSGCPRSYLQHTGTGQGAVKSAKCRLPTNQGQKPLRRAVVANSLDPVLPRGSDQIVHQHAVGDVKLAVEIERAGSFLAAKEHARIGA